MASQPLAQSAHLAAASAGQGKAGQPNEFGKLVQLQKAENHIVTHYEVFEQRPIDRHLLLATVEAHRRKLDRVPGWAILPI